MFFVFVSKRGFCFSSVSQNILYYVKLGIIVRNFCEFINYFLRKYDSLYHGIITYPKPDILSKTQRLDVTLV